ncbi:MAG: quinolinate synthase NadA [Chloroflexi bacterium]|nr:quinolinate synthase NadA [Chloroflexota bacterium]
MTPGSKLAVIERPAAELAALRENILELKKKLKAVIVAHNYQHPEVQDIADFVGDSLELARKSTQLQAEAIVFCGVHFMAETAAILNPEKTVYLAHGTAGCPMANMIDADELREWKLKYPGAAVVCYVNTTAEVKAESDICCTSANAVKVVDSVPGEEIIFVPDENLGKFVAARTKKRMVLYPGYCVTHARLNAEQVKLARSLHPDSPVVVHPECRPEVAALADAVLSTSQMIRFCKENPAKSFLIGTELGILHRMRKEAPDKEFYVISNSLICPNMKKTTLESVLDTMRLRRNIVKVPEDIRLRARRAVDRMLEVV